jgi:hypothetical protein
MQVGAQVLRGGVLAEDVGQGAHDRERPRAAQPAPPGHQHDQDPRGQQREDRDDPPDRRRELVDRYLRHRRQGDDRGAERAERHRRVVRDRGDPDGVEFDDAQADQDRRDHRPRVTEPDQALEERAKRPREQDGLHPDVGGRLGHDPPAEIAERPRFHQRVIDDHPPEGDPVD